MTTKKSIHVELTHDTALLEQYAANLFALEDFNIDRMPAIVVKQEKPNGNKGVVAISNCPILDNGIKRFVVTVSVEAFEDVPSMLARIELALYRCAFSVAGRTNRISKAGITALEALGVKCIKASNGQEYRFNPTDDYFARFAGMTLELAYKVDHDACKLEYPESVPPQLDEITDATVIEALKVIKNARIAGTVSKKQIDQAIKIGK